MKCHNCGKRHCPCKPCRSTWADFWIMASGSVAFLVLILFIVLGFMNAFSKLFQD